jgi:hypothetical protein
MAYTKIKPIKSENHLKRAVLYITRDEKTENKTNIFCNMCNVQSAVLHFRNVRQKAMQKGNNVAHHICISFSPEDNISTDKALLIGQEFMKEMYPYNQYILAVHNDRSHIHCHILVNAVDMKNYKKINSNQKSLMKMRSISDSLCGKYGLSVITSEQKSHREVLKNQIDNAIAETNNFEEFLMFMKNRGYEIKANRHLAFKGKYDKIFIRAESIGTAYKERCIRDRIVNKSVIKNAQKRIYDDKLITSSYRKWLKRYIDNAIDHSKTFDDFLKIMQDDCYIKQGKYLAFRHKYAERFIRAKSVGEDYTEEMIKYRIAFPEDYKKMVENRKATQIYKERFGKDFYTKYNAVKDIDNRINTLNFLAENNIKSYAELFEKIDELKQTETKLNASLNYNNVRISAIKDIKKALQTQWTYKYIQKEYENTDNKTEYAHTHKKELNKYSIADTILENAKNKSVPDLNVELENLEQRNMFIEKKLINVRCMLRNLENIKYNLEFPQEENRKKDVVKETEIPHRNKDYYTR